MKYLLTLTFSLILFGAKSQFRYGDLVIHELMADPAPVVGLPNAEFIELKNVSGKPINLLKWKLGNGGSFAMITSNLVLEPDSLIVLCSKTHVQSFPLPSKTIGITGFPSLANDEDTVSLHDPEGHTIHAVAYKSSCHANTLKQEGGWSLEMKDPKKPCDPNNWSSSIDRNGGTPGRTNSIAQNILIATPITAIQCMTIGPNALLLKLSAPADSISGAMHSRYQLNNEQVSIVKALPLAPMFQTIALMLSDSLKEGKIYQLQGQQVQGCKGEGAHSFSIRTGIAKPAGPGDVLLNELLFNPPPGGVDFIELINTSNSIINAKEIHLAGILPNGQTGTANPMSTSDWNLFPDEPVVITTDRSFITTTWDKSISERILEVRSLPSLPDDAGHIVILNRQGQTLDKLSYQDDMHFPLLRNKEGVSLERISTKQSSGNKNNWHSASANSGYASPTLQNSQSTMIEQHYGDIEIRPSIISPDNDGNADLLTIDYAFKENGIMMTVLVFTATGIQVAKPVDNQLCGIAGSVHWDGLDAKGRRLPAGTYIVMAEYGTLKGTRKKTKRLIGIR